MNQPATTGPVEEAVALYISTKRLSVHAALATAFRLLRQAVKRPHGMAVHNHSRDGIHEKD
jgi:hypothetical protein